MLLIGILVKGFSGGFAHLVGLSFLKSNRQFKAMEK